eukprot:COSAG01_NODE_15271_length_1355_cov_6.460987_1_plen_90_part_00
MCCASVRYLAEVVVEAEGGAAVAVVALLPGIGRVDHLVQQRGVDVGDACRIAHAHHRTHRMLNNSLSAHSRQQPANCLSVDPWQGRSGR